MRLLLIMLAAFSLTTMSCLKDNSPEKQLEDDIQAIKNYLTDHGLTAIERPSGLHYIITQEGTGGNPSPLSTVTVKYKGYLLDGTVFDQTSGTETATFALDGLIEAWQEGIPLLKKGGKGTFFSPSALAYGPNGVGSIAPNSVLIFEIELVNF
ncbi:MAG TPA: FKBP-type peptidyl-prolyl cis-trans isomerase [Saprospiraceae bacterium]|nr:FKBP-type peptidyl-prolyl cis-trans isomerase [Saprospiraceae bacterium]HPI05419.1 FKBP-type peptidyl-prolyl cis-trans isomerase [Saprospiraceae bacterium]